MKSNRGDALLAGEKFYKTNKPCKNGHFAKRSTIDGSCTECRVQLQRQQREAFKELMKAKEDKQNEACS